MSLSGSAFAAPGDMHVIASVGANATSTLSNSVDGETFYYGDINGRFYAISKYGEVLHTKDLDGPVIVPATVSVDGTIYVGTTANTFYALNDDLSVKWQYQTASEIAAAAAVAGNGLVVVADAGGDVYAINSEGVPDWQSTTNAYVGASIAIHNNGNVLVANATGELHALNPDTGAIVFGFSLTEPAEISTFAVGDDGSVYFGAYDNNFYALDSSLNEKWHYPTEGKVVNSPVIDFRGRVFFVEYDSKRLVNLIDNGSDYTEHLIVPLQGKAYSAPLVSSTGRIYVSDLDGRIYAIFPDVIGSDKLEWFVQVDDALASSPTLGQDSYIRFVSSGGDFIVLETDGGTVNGHWPMQGKDRIHTSLAGIDTDSDFIPDVLDLDDDGDLLPDEWEILYGLDPLVAQSSTHDSDSDGLSDVLEHSIGTNPKNTDTDGDGFNDGWEYNHGLNPLVADDPESDADGDTLSLNDEYEAGLNPNSSDTDGDGLPDDWELLYTLVNPLVADAHEDPDGDGYDNLWEYADLLTNPDVNEFDNRHIYDEASQHVSRLVQGSPVEFTGLNFKGGFKIGMAGAGRYVVIHQMESQSSSQDTIFTFERNNETGELTYLSQQEISEGTSVFNSEDATFYLLNEFWSGYPPMLIAYTFNEGAKLWQGSTLDTVNQVYSSSMEPLTASSEVFHQAPDFNDFGGLVSPNGQYLYMTTRGKTGILVYKLNLDGSATFHQQLRSSVTEKNTAISMHVSSDSLFVYVMQGGQLRVYQHDENGYLSNAYTGGTIGTYIAAFDTSNDHASILGLVEDEVILPTSGSSSYATKLLRFDRDLGTLSEQVGPTLKGTFVGTDATQGLLQVGITSWHRDNTGEYRQVAIMDAKIQNEAGDWKTLSSSSPGVMSPDGKHKYYVDTRINGEYGVVGYPVDYVGLGRPDQDGDGIEELYDDFRTDPRFSKDNDNDGYPDEFTSSCDQTCQQNSGYTPQDLDQDDDNDGHPDIDTDGNEFDDTDYFPNDCRAWKDTDKDGLPDFLLQTSESCALNSELVADTDDDNDGYDDYYETGNTVEILDHFSEDPSEWFDHDSDGEGDNADIDDDNDKIPDSWEIAHGLDPFDASDALINSDVKLNEYGELESSIDSLNNLEEYQHGSLPFTKNSDGDMDEHGVEILDGQDALPLDASEAHDSDGDGIGDNADNDDDGDSLNDDWEDLYSLFNGEPKFNSRLNNNIDPLAALYTHSQDDPDGDGLSNFQESNFGTNPFLLDSDGDSLPDGFETSYKDVDPLILQQTDNTGTCARYDGIPSRFYAIEGLKPSSPLSPDTDIDLDCDGDTNIEEYLYGTNPLENEFDHRYIHDEAAQRITRVVQGSPAELTGLNFNDGVKIGMAGGGRYVVIHQEDSQSSSQDTIFTFERNIETGELTYLSQQEISEGTSVFNSEDAAFYLLSEVWSGSNLMLFTYSFNEENKLWERIFLDTVDLVYTSALEPLTSESEVADQVPGFNDFGGLVSPNGQYLYMTTKGKTGILVYKLNPDGSATFHQHLRSSVSEIKTVISMHVSADSLYVYVMQGGQLRVYQHDENGYLSNAWAGGTIGTFVTSFDTNSDYASILGLVEDEVILPSFGSSSYATKLLRFDRGLGTLSETVGPTLKGEYVGTDATQGLLQVGITSWYRDISGVYHQVATMDAKIENDAGDWKALSSSSPGVMSPDGKHMYYVDNRLNGEYGVVGYPVDYLGKRDDTDNDGIADKFDAFKYDASEQSDLDNDGIGNNADLDDDGDGLLDGWEQVYFTESMPFSSECYREGPLFDPLTFDVTTDSDCDGLLDIEEQGIGTNPLNEDTDEDGIPDAWEFVIGLDPLINDANLDPDGDSYSNYREYQLGTTPFYNTFDDELIEQLDSYEDSKLNEAHSILIHPSGKFIYVLSNNQVHRFDINIETGAITFAETVDLPEATHIVSGISLDGAYLYVFSSTSDDGNRSVYEIANDGQLQLSDSQNILRRGVLFPESDQEYYDDFGLAAEALFSQDGRFIYVPTVSLGLMIYERNTQEGSIDFAGYLTPNDSDYDASQGSSISQTPASSSIYIVQGQDIVVFDRDLSDGAGLFRETITNEVAESFNAVTHGVYEKQWLAATDSEVKVKVEDVSQLSFDSQVLALSGHIEVNEHLTGMLYILNEGSLKALSANNQVFEDFSEITLESNSISVSPLSTQIENNGNYLFVLSTVSTSGEKQLLVYTAGVKGIGHVDSDGDGVIDKNDAFPFDPNETEDIDQDGCGDNVDQFINPEIGQPMECLDTDGDTLSDEIGDTDDDNDGFSDDFENQFLSANTDCQNIIHSYNALVFNNDLASDVDNDGLLDIDEQSLGGNPCLSDTDGDGILDGSDTVLLADNNPPVITLLDQDGIIELTIEISSKYDDPGATALDVFDGDLTESIWVRSNINRSNPGNYSITYDVEDAAGNKAITKVRPVTVVDTIKPNLRLVGTNTINVEQGPNCLDASAHKAYVDESCSYYLEQGAAISGQKDYETLSSPVYSNGSTISLNVMVLTAHTVTYTASDTFNDDSTVTRYVNVYPQEAPVIELIGSSEIILALDETINVEFEDPGVIVTDNADTAVYFKLIVSGNVDLSTPGTYTLRYNVTDKSGNPAQEVTRTVIVADEDRPVVELIGSANQTFEVGVDGRYAELGVIASDQTDGVLSAENVTVSILGKTNTSYQSVRTDVIDTYTLTYIATDSVGNVSTPVNRRVNVTESLAPTMTLIGPSTLIWNQSSAWIDPGILVQDNVDGIIREYSSVHNINVAIAGTYTVTYSAEDSANNAAYDPDTGLETLTRSVEVKDIVPPVIDFSIPSTIYHPQGQEYPPVYSEPPVTAYDAVDGAISVSLTGSVDEMTLGTYELLYTSVDTQGNESNKKLYVVVIPVDYEAPLINVDDDRVYSFEGRYYLDHEQGAPLNSINIAAYDLVDGNWTENINITNQFDVNVAGDHAVVLQVGDHSGNLSNEVTVTVRVRDKTAPVLTLLGEPEVNIGLGIDFHSVYIEYGAEAYDEIDGGIVSDNISIDYSQVNTNSIGRYYVLYTVQDSSGNSILATRAINVLDFEKPVINLLGDNEVFIELGTSFVDPGATAYDYKDGALATETITIIGFVNSQVAGNYTLTYSVTDSDLNISVPVTRLVKVIDRLAPLLTLYGPSSIILECGVPTQDPGANASDLGDGDISQLIKRSGALALGSNVTGDIQTSVLMDDVPINYSVTDLSGNSAISMDRLVTVNDTIPPLLNLAIGTNIRHEQGTEFSAPLATAHDQCEGILVNIQGVSNVDRNTAGTYQVLYNIRDGSGNSANELALTVQVSDTMPPRISLNGTQITYHEQGTSYLDAGVTAFDLVEGDITNSVLVTGSVDANIAGSYSLSYSVSDSIGNEAVSITRTVIVSDTTVPIISLLGNTYVNHEQGMVFSDPGATASDSVDGDLSGNIVKTGSVDSNVAGTYILSYNVNDAAGNLAATVTRTIVVSDTTIPVISLSGSASLNHEQGLVYSDAGATASDTFDGDLSGNIMVTGSVDSNTAGTYTLSYNVSDTAGNAASTVTRTVIVTDTTIPVISLSGMANINHEQGTAYSDAGAMASDTFDGDLSGNIVVTGSVDSNAAGSYTLNYNVSDAAGNAAMTVTRKVTVTDTTIPVISLSGSASLNHEQGTVYSDAGATASDSVDGDLSGNIVVSGSVDSNTAGSYTLSYNVSDAAGNTGATVTRRVTVADTTIPVISLTGLATINHEQGTVYSDAGATASDSVDGNLSGNIVVSGSVDSNTVGSYTLIYNVSDATGNAAETVARTVVVSDTTLPVINLNGSASISHEQGTAYSDAGAAASDSVDGNLSSSIIVTGSVNVNVAGIYMLSYNVSDAAGNAAVTVTRMVSVADTTIPVISLTGLASINHEQGMVYSDAGAAANDTVDGDLTANIMVTGSVDSNAAGTYTLNFNVSDAAGNNATTVTRTVTVTDTTIPVLSLMGLATINHEQGVIYSDEGAAANDSVDGDLTESIVMTGSVDSNTAGTYILSYNVSDAAGNAAAVVTRTVTVADTTVPVISLTGLATINHEQGLLYSDAGAAANDTVDGDLSGNISVTGSVDSNAAGTYTLSYNVSDAAGNMAATVTRIVVVLDTTTPVITLTGDAIAIHEQGMLYSDPGASASDNIDGDITGSILVNNPVNPNLAGIYMVTYDVSDAAGNSADQVQRTIIVSDNTVPIILLTGADIINHEQGTVFSDLGAEAADNIDGDITGSITVNNSVNPDVAGTYTVTYDVSDAAGNVAVQVQRTVIVSDTTIPVITLTGAAIINHEQGTVYTDPAASATDNTDGNITDSISVNNSVNPDVAGTYTVTYDVSDAAGNSAVQVLRTVIVADTTKPVIMLLGAATITLEQGLVYSDPGGSATDNVDGNISDNVLVNHTVNPNVAGTYTVTYDVSDAAGNAALQVQRTVIVSDATIPVIILTGAAILNHEQGIAFSDPGASATDNIDGNLTANIIVNHSVNPNVAGMYTVTYDVNDAAGNAALQVQRTVVVADTTIPVITLTGAISVTHEQGATYTDLGASAADNFDGNISADIVVNNAVNPNVAGTYIVTYDVSDAAGNVALQLQRTVTVADTGTPVITLTGADSLTHEQGTAYSDPGAIATDNFNGDISVDIVVNNAVNPNIAGTYTVTYDVSDAAGNAAPQVQRIVVVADTTTPEITLIGAGSVTHEQGAAYSDPGASAADNIDGDISADIVVNNAVNPNVSGTYTVSYEVSDSSGNAAVTVTRIVVITDTEIPVINLTGFATLNHDQGTVYTDAGAAANDSVDGDITANIVMTGVVDFNTAGSYILTYNVSDTAGNSATTVSRTVNVMDQTAPLINLSGDSIVSHEQGTVYSDEGATASDTVDGDLTANIVMTGTVDINAIGSYILTYSVSDAAENSTSATRTVEVTLPNVIDTTGIVVKVDNSTRAFTHSGHDFAESWLSNSNYVNDDYATMRSPGFSTADSFFQYALTGLPEELGRYAISMNTSVYANACDGLSYQVLDEDLNIMDSFLVDHSGPNFTYNQQISVGNALLKKGYFIRIDTSTSVCSYFEKIVTLDELVLTGF